MTQESSRGVPLERGLRATGGRDLKDEGVDERDGLRGAPAVVGHRVVLARRLGGAG